MRDRASITSPVKQNNLVVFLGIWAVCAVAAGFIWNDLVANTPPFTLSISFTALLVLGISFGLPGAGLIWMAINIFREP